MSTPEVAMPQSLTNSIHIDAPVAEVFACVRDPSHFDQLMPDVTFSDVSLTPDGVGTTYRFETRVAGLPIRGRGEYTEFTPDRHVHDETTVASEGSFDWTFEAEGDGVRVTITHLPGRYWGLPVIGRLLAANYGQMDRQILARLKTRLEDHS
jgi:uncharacterized protein YndB with AHSA1/START domain